MGSPEIILTLNIFMTLKVPESGTVKINEVKKLKVALSQVIWPQIKKLLALCFLHLGKLGKIKYPYFFIRGKMAEITAFP